MKNTTCYPKAAVSAIIIRNNKVLLVNRGCEPNKGLWSLPGGSIEPGETVREALAREVLEETCLNVRVGNIATVHDVISRDGDSLLFHYVIISFFAEVLSGDLTAASDAADARWFSPEEIRHLQTTPGLVERLESAGVMTAQTSDAS